MPPGNEISRLLFDALTSLVMQKKSASQKKRPGQHVIIAPFKPSGLKYIPVWQDTSKTQSGDYRGESMRAFERPEGMRFYLGAGINPDPNIALELSEIDAGQKVRVNPADSVRSNNVFTEMKMNRNIYQHLLDLLKSEPRYSQTNTL